MGTCDNSAGDAAAMREALLALKKLDFNKEEDCYAFYRIIDEALAKPPRNCDVDTADEQAERFVHYCYTHKSCESCPLLSVLTRCEFVWAQMPYKAQKDKEGNEGHDRRNNLRRHGGGDAQDRI